MPLCKLKVKFNLHIKHINIEGKVDYEEAVKLGDEKAISSITVQAGENKNISDGLSGEVSKFEKM